MHQLQTPRFWRIRHSCLPFGAEGEGQTSRQAGSKRITLEKLFCRLFFLFLKKREIPFSLRADYDYLLFGKSNCSGQGRAQAKFLHWLEFNCTPIAAGASPKAAADPVRAVWNRATGTAGLLGSDTASGRKTL